MMSNGNHISITTPEHRLFDKLSEERRAEQIRRMSLKGDLLSLAVWLTFIAAIVIYAIVKS